MFLWIEFVDKCINLWINYPILGISLLYLGDKEGKIYTFLPENKFFPKGIDDL